MMCYIHSNGVHQNISIIQTIHQLTRKHSVFCDRPKEASNAYLAGNVYGVLNARGNLPFGGDVPGGGGGGDRRGCGSLDDGGLVGDGVFRGGKEGSGLSDIVFGCFQKQHMYQPLKEQRKFSNEYMLHFDQFEVENDNIIN